MVSVRSLQPGTMNLQQQLVNLTGYTTSFFNESQLDDGGPALSFDDIIDGAAIDNNFSNPFCPSFTYQNETYLNVSCDTELKFSVPLYGESVNQ